MSRPVRHVRTGLFSAEERSSGVRSAFIPAVPATSVLPRIGDSNVGSARDSDRPVREASRSVKGSLAPVARFSAVGQARPASGNRGVPRMWLIRRWVASLCALFACASPLFAQDGRSLYKGTCAACHDSAVERIPSRETLNAMTPERVLAAMESGPMIAMASRLSASERRAVAEFAATSSPRRCRARAALCCSRCSR